MLVNGSSDGRCRVSDTTRTAGIKGNCDNAIILSSAYHTVVSAVRAYSAIILSLFDLDFCPSDPRRGALRRKRLPPPLVFLTYNRGGKFNRIEGE
jgi:hypothetical protein